jgi:hypothetical protein
LQIPWGDIFVAENDHTTTGGWSFATNDQHMKKKMALHNTTFIRMRSNAGPLCSQYNISIHNKENMKYIVLTVILMITTLQCHAAESRFLRWGGNNRNRNRRQGQGGGGGGGPGGNGLIPKLIENRDKISRSVVDYSDGDQHGVRTVTGAKNSVDNKDEINDWIYAHVQEMQNLSLLC